MPPKNVQLVSCLYVNPKNLALGRASRQSSEYDGLGASLAVDGDHSGDHYRKCNCTQQDPQGWWEVDLGQLVHIHKVKVVSLSASCVFVLVVDELICLEKCYIFSRLIRCFVRWGGSRGVCRK